MGRESVFIKGVIDKRSHAVLERFARNERRSLQMQTGIILRNVAALIEKNPKALIDSGILKASPSELQQVA